MSLTVVAIFSFFGGSIVVSLFNISHYLGRIARSLERAPIRPVDPLIPYYPPDQRAHGIRAGVDPRDTR